MDEMLSPKFTSDSFIPFPSETNNRTNIRSNNERRSNFSNDKPSSSGLNNTAVIYSPNIPWKSVQSYSCGIIGLHEEINDFYEKMRPTEQEEDIRLRVIEHITKIVHSLWPLAKVEVFGSFRTGLYLPSSDIDIVVAGEWRNLPLSTLSQALQQNGVSQNDINIIDKASVPIIKMVHTPTKIRVDISFNLTNGVQGAKLIKKLMKMYPPLPKLVIVLKQFLVQRGLNEVFNGGMSSYCLTLLIVSFLQGFHKPKTTQPSSNLGTLLLEFFEHYGLHFNYEKVSIHFNPGDMTCGMYQPKNKHSSPLLSVEDPLVKGNDLAKGTFLIKALKLAFENAFLVLHKAVSDSAAEQQPYTTYLGSVVQVDDKVWQERKWLSENYSSLINRLSTVSSVKKESEDTLPFKRKKKYWY